jgi:hypothetical protein
MRLTVVVTVANGEVKLVDDGIGGWVASLHNLVIEVRQGKGG